MQADAWKEAAEKSLDWAGAIEAPAQRDHGSMLAPSQRMRIAYLLTLVGGYLDAYTYFERGGVFANAQTGNIVKLGIALANGERDLYLRYLLPIVMFALGLLMALGITEYLQRKGIRLVRRCVLLSEMIALSVVALIPNADEWNTTANCIVSFAAAMQYETFTTFRGDAIVTTMSTGNLRKTVDALFKGIVNHNSEELLRAGRYLSIIATFTFGAFLGTKVCGVLDRSAVLPAVAGLGLAVAIITELRRRQLANAASASNM